MGLHVAYYYTCIYSYLYSVQRKVQARYTCTAGCFFQLSKWNWVVEIMHPGHLAVTYLDKLARLWRTIRQWSCGSLRNRTSNSCIQNIIYPTDIKPRLQVWFTRVSRHHVRPRYALCIIQLVPYIYFSYTRELSSVFAISFTHLWKLIGDGSKRNKGTWL